MGRSLGPFLFAPWSRNCSHPNAQGNHPDTPSGSQSGGWDAYRDVSELYSVSRRSVGAFPVLAHDDTPVKARRSVGLRLRTDTAEIAGATRKSEAHHDSFRRLPLCPSCQSRRHNGFHLQILLRHRVHFHAADGPGVGGTRAHVRSQPDSPMGAEAGEGNFKTCLRQLRMSRGE